MSPGSQINSYKGWVTPLEKHGKLYFPPAMYILTYEEKNVFCGFLSCIKVPGRYFINFQTLVSLKEKKIYGMK